MSYPRGRPHSFAQNSNTEGSKLIIWITKVSPENKASIGEVGVLGTWEGMPEQEQGKD